MCTLLVDIEIETGSVAADPDDAVVVECAAGRVIIAASAYISSATSSGVPKWPVAVTLTDGAPTDSVAVDAAGAGIGHGSQYDTIFYALTTGRLAEL